MFLSFFGAGYLKPAPGTWGSLAALLVALPLTMLLSPVLFLVLIALVYFLGVQATRSEMAETGEHDPGWIVIDEVAGQWIALLPTVFGAWRAEEPLIALWPGVIAAFLFFRLFDIWKPWLVGRMDARDDAVGVMADDVFAGLFAAVAVSLLALVFHALFLT